MSFPVLITGISLGLWHIKNSVNLNKCSLEVLWNEIFIYHYSLTCLFNTIIIHGADDATHFQVKGTKVTLHVVKMLNIITCFFINNLLITSQTASD